MDFWWGKGGGDFSRWRGNEHIFGLGETLPSRMNTFLAGGEPPPIPPVGGTSISLLSGPGRGAAFSGRCTLRWDFLKTIKAAMFS